MGLTRYVFGRLGQLLPVVVGMSIASFLLVHLIPGNAIELYLGTQVSPTPEQMEELKRIFGLSGPIYEQYGRWALRILHGDMGYSLRTGQPVLPSILNALPLSAELAFLAILFAVIVGVPLGVLAAARRNTTMDLGVRTFGLLGLSIPDFWLATLAVIVLSRFPLTSSWVALGRYVPLEVSPLDNLKILAVPAVAFGLGLAAVLMRFTRTAALDVLSSDYVRTARAKGLTDRAVLYRHVLRNALFPVITVVGYYAGYLIGGTAVIEQVFALPGMGRFVLQAVSQRDYPVVQGVVLVVGAAFVLVNLLVDIGYTLLDPRVRYS